MVNLLFVVREEVPSGRQLNIRGRWLRLAKFIIFSCPWLLSLCASLYFTPFSSIVQRLYYNLPDFSIPSS